MRYFHRRLGRRAESGARALGAIALASACVIAPLATVLVAPSASLAATATSITLSTGPASVKTTNGDAWSMGVGWVGSGSPTGDAFLSVGIIRTVTAGGTGAEIHEWEFDVTDPTLAFDTTTEKGTLDSGTQASPVGTVDLTLAATASRKGTCSSGSETIYTVTVKGESEIVTGFKLGGTVGSKTLTFTGTSTLTESFSCVVASFPCSPALVWGSSTTPTVLASGISEVISGKTYDFIEVGHKTALSSPKQASRDDVALLHGPAGSYDKTTKVLTISSSSAGIVTGSATMSGGTYKSVSVSCVSGGKTIKGTLTDVENPKYASPAGKELTGHTVLSGNLVAPASSTNGNIEMFS
jgi:hypothetical protein